jgi:hypothetical protein
VTAVPAPPLMQVSCNTIFIDSVVYWLRVALKAKRQKVLLPQPQPGEVSATRSPMQHVRRPAACFPICYCASSLTEHHGYPDLLGLRRGTHRSGAPVCSFAHAHRQPDSSPLLSPSQSVTRHTRQRFHSIHSLPTVTFPRCSLCHSAFTVCIYSTGQAESYTSHSRAQTAPCPPITILG